MPVDAVMPSVSATASTPTTTPPPQPATSSETLGGLGRGAFMQLLLTQMRYQDPLSPMEDQDFIAQLAQINTLEQLEQLNESLSTFMGQQNLLRGAELIGKTIRGTTAQGEHVEGVAVAVRTTGTEVMVSLGDKEIRLKDVSLVTQ